MCVLQVLLVLTSGQETDTKEGKVGGLFLTLQILHKMTSGKSLN